VFLVVHELVLINTDSNMHGDKIKIAQMIFVWNIPFDVTIACFLVTSFGFEYEAPSGTIR
jgi:hypothetical protein